MRPLGKTREAPFFVRGEGATKNWQKERVFNNYRISSGAGLKRGCLMTDPHSCCEDVKEQPLRER
jgi:hypothetical protein